MLTVPRYALLWAGEDHPDVQGRLGCTRLVMAPQPPSAKNGTLQSDVDIPDEQDRSCRPPPPKRSDNDHSNYRLQLKQCVSLLCAVSAFLQPRL